MNTQKTKILIVEDENIIALDLKRTLIKLGYNPIAAVSTGEKAIETARSHKPDIILMDINLKGKLNGVEAASIITSEEDVPIIFLSALNTLTNFKSLNIVKAAGHLLKPFDEVELQNTLLKALSRTKEV